MKTKFAILGLGLATSSLLFAQSKEDERLANSVSVMKELLGDK